MPIESAGSTSNLPTGARIAPRQARALTGLEVIDAVISSLGFVLEEIEADGAEMVRIRAQVRENLNGKSLLYAEHLVYPGVSWLWIGSKGPVKDSKEIEISLLLTLQLDRKTIVIEYGPTLGSEGTKTAKLEQLPTPRPDEIRQKWLGGAKLDLILPTGKRETVTISSNPHLAAISTADSKTEPVKAAESTVKRVETPASDLVASPPQLEVAQKVVEKPVASPSVRPKR